MRGHSCVGPSHAYACGSEPFWSIGEYGFPVRCSDCGAPPGGNHHPGCTKAECALGCEDQAMFCHHSQEPPPVREFMVDGRRVRPEGMERADIEPVMEIFEKEDQQ